MPSFSCASVTLTSFGSRLSSATPGADAMAIPARTARTLEQPMCPPLDVMCADPTPCDWIAVLSGAGLGERGLPPVPVRRLFVGVGEREHLRLREGRAADLQPNGQTRTRESARDREGRNAVDVERRRVSDHFE